MAKITIIIDGIAMCYLPNSVWRVIFPFNDCHEVRYNPDTENIPLKGANREITVTVINPKTGSSAKPQFRKLFNLTEKNDYEAHTDGIKPKQNWEQHGVLLKISNAAMDLVKETRSRYQLKLNGQLKHNFGKLGHSARAEIDINAGGSVTINVPGHPDFPKIFTTDATVTFNNNCYNNQPTSTSDLHMLYDFIIEDKHSTKQFEIDRHPDDKPHAGKGSGTPPREDPGVFAPDSHDPAPLQEGLPCYVVRADDTSDLP